jgi:hypothetical protein
MRKRGQRGRAKATVDLIDTCIEIIEQVRPITVRGVCYRLFVAGHIDSMATKNTQKISRLLVEAREEGSIPWEWIVDESRRMEGGGGYRDLQQYAGVIERAYRRDFWSHQPWRVVVISEKSTVAGILGPVLDEFGVEFFSAHGYISATKAHDFAEAIGSDDRQSVFLYVGDYDCSGMHMSEVDLPGRLRKYGSGEFHLERIALTEDDIDSLPSFDAKDSDKRYDWYIENYGAKAWELDAMDPNDLRERVEAEITEYVDPEAWERHKRVEAAQRETVKSIAAKMAEAVA